MPPAAPTPDEIIAMAGCADADCIERCLIAVCDREMHRPDDEPQNIELAFNCVRAVILRLDGNEAPEMQQYLAGALFRRAQFLAQFDRPDDARRDYQDVAYTWDDSSDPVVRSIVAANFLEAGQFEEEQGHIGEAEKYYGQAAKYADDPMTITQKQVIDALSNHAEIHIRRGWLDPALEMVSDIRARWQDHPEYWIRRRLANLLVVYADGVKQDDERCEEALPLLDDAIAYADRALQPPAYFIQAGAWMSKCHCLEKLERHEEAVACADAFAQWVADVVRAEPDYPKSSLAMVEGSLGRACLVKASCLNKLGRNDEALAAFRQSGVTLDDLGDDFDKRQRACNDMIRLVKILADLGRKQEAEDLHDEISRRMFSYGEHSFETMTLVSLGMMHSYIEDGPDWFEKVHAETDDDTEPS